MKYRVKSKTSLFLMELILTIAIFAVASAICMQLFVKSREYSHDSYDLDNASIICQNIHELIQGNNGKLDYLKQQYCMDNQGNIYFDKYFQLCKKDQSSYKAQVKCQYQERSMDIQVHIYKDNECIYKRKMNYVIKE